MKKGKKVSYVWKNWDFIKKVTFRTSNGPSWKIVELHEFLEYKSQTWVKLKLFIFIFYRDAEIWMRYLSLYSFNELWHHIIISSIDQVQEVLLLSKTSILPYFFASIGVLLTCLIDWQVKKEKKWVKYDRIEILSTYELTSPIQL